MNRGPGRGRRSCSDGVASHRDHPTPKGRTVITALLTARQANIAKLTAMAA